MDNTIEENLTAWDRSHAWTLDGDEWRGQARLCGKSYEDWKRSIVDRLLRPNAAGADVLEIGSGHGRWSVELAGLCRRLWLVDLSPSCIESCRARLAGRENVEFAVTDGTSLPGELSGQVDFVWSFAAFVHMSAEVTRGYFGEIGRVLRPGGVAVIHHPGRRHASLPFGVLRRLGSPGRAAYRYLSMGIDEREDGWRSNVSGPLVRRVAGEAGLVVERQARDWGDGYGVPRHRDLITTARKPG
jgi:SAM-dependent methyltransferase